MKIGGLTYLFLNGKEKCRKSQKKKQIKKIITK